MTRLRSRRDLHQLLHRHPLSSGVQYMIMLPLDFILFPVPGSGWLGGLDMYYDRTMMRSLFSN